MVALVRTQPTSFEGIKTSVFIKIGPTKKKARTFYLAYPKVLKHRFSKPTKFEQWGFGLRESFCFFLAVKSKCSSNSDIFADSSFGENFLVINFAKKFTAVWPNSVKAYCNQFPKTPTHPPWFTVDSKILAHRIFFFWGSRGERPRRGKPRAPADLGYKYQILVH